MDNNIKKFTEPKGGGKFGSRESTPPPKPKSGKINKGTKPSKSPPPKK